MLLILQTATDKSTPDLQLQELLTYVVKPYLCRDGLFMGPGKPVIRYECRKSYLFTLELINSCGRVVFGINQILTNSVTEGSPKTC